MGMFMSDGVLEDADVLLDWLITAYLLIAVMPVLAGPVTMILPAFGIISRIVPAFARKPLFGYASMVYATALIAWIPVLTGVKVFNWIATMWHGSMTFETPVGQFAVRDVYRVLLLGAEMDRSHLTRRAANSVSGIR
jgi:heme/copper-type cytochrome/quinol oxidase subunit 1